MLLNLINSRRHIYLQTHCWSQKSRFFCVFHIGFTVWSMSKCEVFLLRIFVSSSYHRRCFIKKAVVKNFAIFPGKYWCWSHILIKLQPFKLATALKRDSDTGVFLRILQNFYEHLSWETYSKSCFCVFGITSELIHINISTSKKENLELKKFTVKSALVGIHEFFCLQISRCFFFQDFHKVKKFFCHIYRHKLP